MVDWNEFIVCCFKDWIAFGVMISGILGVILYSLLSVFVVFWWAACVVADCLICGDSVGLVHLWFCVDLPVFCWWCGLLLLNVIMVVRR